MKKEIIMSLFTCLSTILDIFVQASLKTILVSHIGRHEGRKFEMVSRWWAVLSRKV